MSRPPQLNDPGSHVRFLGDPRSRFAREHARPARAPYPGRPRGSRPGRPRHGSGGGGGRLRPVGARARRALLEPGPGSGHSRAGAPRPRDCLPGRMRGHEPRSLRGGGRRLHRSGAPAAARPRASRRGGRARAGLSRRRARHRVEYRAHPRRDPASGPRSARLHGLLRHFKAISYSDEVGYRKPDGEIFRRTLAELGFDAGEAAHVGDNPIADVRGAQSVGMRGVHYATAGRQGASHADLIVADLGDLVSRLTR